MKKITFIHAADLHLDSPLVGLKHLPANIHRRLRESTFNALKKLTDAAIKLEVDFVILAGDLYDGEDRSLRAQSRFRIEMQKLADKGISVFVIHGNHDHLNGSWIHLDLPANVYVFGSNVEMKPIHTKSGEKVHLYGFSYPQRHVFEKKIDEYRKIDFADFHIGLLHGNEGGREEHDNYAPFFLKDLYEKHFDYWALGHIHKRAILSETPPIIYPGNIQGRNKKEIGIKGCYYVTLSDSEQNFEFVQTSDVVWEHSSVDVSGANSFQEILQMCQIELNRHRKTNIATLLTLHLKNVQLDDNREKRVLDSELLELLLESEIEEESFVWIVELMVSENQEIERKQLCAEANFYEELFNTVENYQHSNIVLAPLYEHHLGRKYLAELKEEEQIQLLQRAEKLLINLLYQK